MSQYTPWGRAAAFRALDRPLRKSEIRGAEAYMANLGLEGFTQGVEAAKAEYIAFDLTGGVRGHAWKSRAGRLCRRQVVRFGPSQVSTCQVVSARSRAGIQAF